MSRKRLIALTVLISAAVIAAISLSGLLHREKIKPGSLPGADPMGFKPDHTVNASVEIVTEWYEAVGTVRPHTEAHIGSRITGQVIDVKSKTGDRVRKNQLLILLDERQYRSQLDQARQGLETAISGKHQTSQAVIAAEALYVQAQAAYNRTKIYFQSQAATAQDMEQAEAVYLRTEAELNRAKEALKSADISIRQAEEAVNEASISLGYTRITAPEDGIILKRLIEPGDLALPGKPLLLFQGSGRLRLEAFVREGLITKVHPGASLTVDMTTLGKTMEGIVDEIVPYADPKTRTFMVKISLPGLSGMYPGMFGKLRIPVAQHRAVMIPSRAISHVGQIELVTVKEDDRWVKRFIKTGYETDGRVEVLAGLNENDIIGVGN